MTSKTVEVTVPCSDCGDPFQTPLLAGRRVLFRCPMCGEAALKEDEQRRAEAQVKRQAYYQREWLTSVHGVPRRYQGNDWQGFKFDRGGEEGNEARVRAIREYAESLPVDARPTGAKSLVLASETNGVGKTMLACLLLHTVFKRSDATRFSTPPAQFWSAADVKLRVKNSERYGSKETPEDVFRDFASMWLLVLDDVGKEQLRGAEAAVAYETYFTILNARYNAELPVVLTSNLGFEPWQPEGPSLIDLMGRASVSRLVEMTGGQMYLIEGDDRR